MEFYIERYKKREELVFDCEVITPMFLSGADPKNVELRAASIKGALRFWWRALYGENDIANMRKKEAELFGNTEKKSKVKISIKNEQFNFTTGLSGGKTYLVESSRGRFNLKIFDYLAFGLCDYDKNLRVNKYIRSHIIPGSRFSLVIELHNCTQTEKDQIINSLSCLHYYGGIGSRSRNGFGSISITPNDNTINLTQSNNFTGELKNYTSFSSNSRIFEIANTSKWEDALSDIGLAYREARLSIERKHSFALRPYIAKPLIVKNENIKITDRHAKPYFLHVRKELKNGKANFIGSILFLPYLYNGDRKNYQDACNKLNVYLEKKNIFQGGR
ncbi:MAG TPA: type III-B CRISPR module RAMP protein Cmr1 [Spirochaetales bacterium]|nr:type III-B CRISPR module RAMP protein Cmr1 [Spirochaetales bacterium]HQK33101.1 type III-B CRISPR module RAMP protein Cmr1 [Spirochaetales bacterium]